MPARPPRKGCANEPRRPHIDLAILALQLLTTAAVGGCIIHAMKIVDDKVAKKQAHFEQLHQAK